MQCDTWRCQLGCVGPFANLKPWTSLQGLRFTGLSQTPRILELLDCTTICVLGGAQATHKVLQASNARELIQECMQDIVIDVSQNASRKAFTNAAGFAKCLHTATCLYSFAQDRVILPMELMLLQGHSMDLQVPHQMRPAQLHDLAGMGICLPCLGVIITSLLLTTF